MDVMLHAEGSKVPCMQGTPLQPFTGCCERKGA